MDGIHDLGGMHGFGRMRPEPDEPAFHADWERRALGIQVALEATGVCNTDEHRHAIELIPPVHYLADAYYERWLDGTERILAERGIVAREELARRVDGLRRARSARLPVRHDPSLRATVDRALAQGATKRRRDEQPALFAVGDAVRGRNEHPPGHTRIPRYARGRAGTVIADYGVYAFADTLAAGLGESPQRLYCVAFRGDELWGADAEPNSTVHLDLFEPYLEAVA